MFENEFFPTPTRVIAKMLAPYFTTDLRYVRRRLILEPSAGKGDICDYITASPYVNKQDISCIEIDPDLQFILQGKGYRLIDSDFLEYEGAYAFDLIAMNPPFSNGVDHLLKAWEIVDDGGDVVCLLNAESIRNPHSAKRKLLARIIEAHGSCEEIGRAFDNAERKTDVEVALIRLHKPEVESVIDFGDGRAYDKEQVSDEEFAANPLAHFNIIESLVAQYLAAQNIVAQKHKLLKQYRFYISGVVNQDHDDRKANLTLNEELDELKKHFWKYVFEKTKLGRVTTSDFQKKFDEFSAKTAAMSFSVRNIENVLRMFFVNRVAIMEECLLHVFDQATKYHEKNREHTEGWKTNKSYRVSRKVIMPYGVEFDHKWGGWKVNWYQRDFFTDIDKVLCYLDGRDLETITALWDVIHSRVSALNRDSTMRYDAEFCSTYFKIRFFKKGTVHIEFLDKKLWDEFNLRAAKGKNWVGGGY